MAGALRRSGCAPFETRSTGSAAARVCRERGGCVRLLFVSSAIRIISLQRFPLSLISGISLCIVIIVFGIVIIVFVIGYSLHLSSGFRFL